jgi:Spy/CpxP family protein refolding chaperone
MQRQRLLALALAVAGVAAFSSPAPAQQPGSPPAQARPDSGRRMFDPIGRLLARRSELAITDEQARRLEAIRGKYLEKNRPLLDQLRREHAARDSARRADSKSRESRRALRASMDSARTEVMAILTPEQRTKVEELRKEWRAERRGGRHGGWHHGRKDERHESHERHRDGGETADSASSR